METVIDAVRGEGQWRPEKPGMVASSFGNITTISRRLGIARETVYAYAKRWSTVAKAIDDERERRKDFVEDKMLERIMNGSDTMIIFFAKTQMKDRGYVERSELTGPDGSELKTPVYIIENRPKSDDT